MPNNATRKRKRVNSYRRGGKKRQKRASEVPVVTEVVDGQSNTLFRGQYGTILMRPTQKMLFKYSEVFTLNAATASTAIQIYRANDLHDPNYSGGGHQPRGFDQAMQFYDHFVVIASSIRVTFHNEDTSQAQIAFVSLKDSATTSTDYTEYLEDIKTEYCVVEPRVSGASVKTVELKCNPNRFLGRSKPMADPELKGAQGVTPTEVAYFHIGSAAVDGGDPSTMDCVVVINYMAVLIEPKRPPQS